MKALVSGRELLGLVVALHLACGASVFADEAVTPIQSIMVDPDSFHRQIVTLQGRVKNVTSYGGNDGTNRPLCIQEFTLKDETGSIAAIYSTRCQVGDEKAMVLAVGDRLLMEAVIDAPADNMRTAKGEGFGVKAQARKITRLEK
jgi:hypothetical protein